jgi:hypothetical protein
LFVFLRLFFFWSQPRNARQMLAFLPISKAHENKLFIFLQFTYICSSQLSGNNIDYNKRVVRQNV